MTALSETEYSIAEKYCHGLTDKEVAEELGKPIWTIRTHKKHIHAKLGISTTHELVLYMVSLWSGKAWNIKEVRQKGLAAVMCVIMLFYVSAIRKEDFYRVRRLYRRAGVEYAPRRTEA